MKVIDVNLQKSKFKNIVVASETYLQLKQLGQAGDSFNDVIKNLIAQHGDNE